MIHIKELSRDGEQRGAEQPSCKYGKVSLNSTIVGNRTVPSGRQFYWEAKITTVSGKQPFKIGFMGYYAGDKTHEAFSLSCRELDVSSPALKELVHLCYPNNRCSSPVIFWVLL